MNDGPAAEPEADALLVDYFGVLTGPQAARVWELVHEVHDAGFVTVLVSNAWGFSGPVRDRLDAAFDHLVVSGEVGVGKPAAGIFALACERAGARPERCLFVDDAPRNVAGAQRSGLQAHLHTDAWTTTEVVRGGFGL